MARDCGCSDCDGGYAKHVRHVCVVAVTVFMAGRGEAFAASCPSLLLTERRYVFMQLHGITLTELFGLLGLLER